MLRSKMLEPNKPESNGSKGWLMGRFNAAKPRLPESAKIINARNFWFSLKMRNKDARIKR